MKEENSFDHVAKQIQDDLKGIIELSGRLIELDKEEKKVNRGASKFITAAVLAGLLIAVLTLVYVFM